MKRSAYVVAHLRKIQRYSMLRFFMDIVRLVWHFGGWKNVKSTAEQRFLDGHKKYGKWRKLNYKAEALEELGDTINYFQVDKGD